MQTRQPMALHRQYRITFLLICFALQIPAVITMWALGVPADYSPLVVLIPAAGLGLSMVSRKLRP
jgi:hypothetical protein